MSNVLRTDTSRLPRQRPALDTTTEIRPPWLKPPVRSVHVTPRQAWSRRWRRARTSPFVADVLTGVRVGLAVLAAAAAVWCVWQIGYAFYLGFRSLGELLAAFGWLIP